MTEPERKGLGHWLDELIRRIFAPQPIVRLEAVRIVLPLAIVGFMSSRIIHADDWLSVAGFRVPPLEDDWRQPAQFAGLLPWAAWAVAIGLLVSGLLTSIGAFTRWSASVFAVLLVYVALADRLAAFTVSKISPVIAIVLALSPAGARWSVDAWRKRRRDPNAPEPQFVSGGPVRFFQIMLPVFYFSSALCKARHDWLSDPYVLWSHLHDSYQTPVSWLAANYTPKFMWTVLQGTTLFYEMFAPILFWWRRTRPYALAYGVTMHTMIGTMFGPVAWFALVMMGLLVASFAPETWLDPTLVIARREAGARAQ